MKERVRGKLWITSIMIFAIIFLIPVLGLAEAIDQPEANSLRFGVLTLIPPVVAITLAFISKNVVLSLFVGAFSGTVMLELKGANILLALFEGMLNLIQKLLESLADPWNAGIVLQVLTIGGLIGLVSRMGGARAIAESLAKRAKTPRSAQMITWLLGIAVFFDDYANALIVGPIMRPVTDKMNISREKLAFIIDGTAAPIAGIALVSTWIGYELSLIRDGYELIGQTVNPYGVFMSTIPYRFYNIFMLAFIFMGIVRLREFGPMHKAERRARTEGMLMREGANPMVSSEIEALEPKEGIRLSVWNAIIPIGILMIGALLGFYYNGYQYIVSGDDFALIDRLRANPVSFFAIRETFGAADASIVLFQSALIASMVAILMGVKQKMFKLGEAIDIWISGMKSLLITGVILLLAWSLSSTIKDLGTAVYLINILGDAPESVLKSLNFLLPAIIFILGSVISFATGTSYGTMGILMPLAIPLAFSINPDQGYIVMSIGAVLTGAIFGDHCCPISDTTILSSMGAACDHIDHTRTQLFYALVVAAISVVLGYILVGIGVHVGFALLAGIASLFVILRLFGKSVDK